MLQIFGALCFNSPGFPLACCRFFFNLISKATLAKENTMKTIMTALFACIASASASAQPINLPAGGSIGINGDVVNCQGPSESSLPPACSIHQENGVYHLYVGSSVAETFYSFNAAVEGAKEMKAAGFCR
jgi:hypothetical protein